LDTLRKWNPQPGKLLPVLLTLSISPGKEQVLLSNRQTEREDIIGVHVGSPDS
jgi:hypothetical protein